MENWTDDFGTRLLVHDKSVCEGQICSIHNPSNHRMKHWRQLWRGDRRIMERVCPTHGVGHPDPDCIYATKDGGIHGCCGCCCDSTNNETKGIEYPDDVQRENMDQLDWRKALQGMKL